MTTKTKLKNYHYNNIIDVDLFKNLYASLYMQWNENIEHIRANTINQILWRYINNFRLYEPTKPELEKRDNFEYESIVKSSSMSVVKEDRHFILTFNPENIAYTRNIPDATVFWPSHTINFNLVTIAGQKILIYYTSDPLHYGIIQDVFANFCIYNNLNNVKHFNNQEDLSSELLKIKVFMLEYKRDSSLIRYLLPEQQNQDYAQSLRNEYILTYKL